MKKAFKYRIYPTKKQTSKLEEIFELCRELHNAAIEERQNAYGSRAKSISYSIQQNQICVEALRILNMMQNEKLSKSIADAAWGMFFSCLDSKAEEAGRLLIQVPARYTSQECCICHNRKELTLAHRIYKCSNPECNMVLDRDWNAALNILRLGLQSVRL